MGIWCSSAAILADHHQAHILWLLASIHFKDGRESVFRDKMTVEVAKTFSDHLARYQGVAPAEVIQYAKDGYAKFAAQYKLHPLQEVSAPQAKLAKPMESMMKAFL